MNGRVATAALLAALLPASRARAAGEAGQLLRLEKLLDKVGEQTRFVANEYGQRGEPPEAEQVRKRYSDAQIQYLLGDYSTAAALLGDVVENPFFAQDPAYPDAVFFLADSLYRTADYFEARRYYRLIFDKRQPRAGEALLKLIDISDKVNDYSGIDEYFNYLRSNNQSLKPEMAYVYAKWVARRPDLDDTMRVQRAMESFAVIPRDSGFGMQALYFTGVLQVQKGDLGAALATFVAVAKDLSARDGKNISEKNAKVRDLANLAIGRLYFEQGKWPEAVDRYQEVGRESEYYNDALFEISATFLKMGSYQKALDATELLILLSEDSSIAPEAKVLEGNLYLKLARYDEAKEVFENVVATYGPVRDQINALLTKRADPVAYFNDLLEKGEKSLDVTMLLPQMARKYVTGKDVASALHIVHELDASKHGAEEGLQIADKLIAAVGQGQLDIFPALQEGNARAVEVDNSLADLEAQFVALHTTLVGGKVTPDVQRDLELARGQRKALDDRFQELPKNEAATAARKARLLKTIGELETAVFKLEYALKSMQAQLTGDEVWLTESLATLDATAVSDFRSRITHERELVTALEGERQDIVRELAAGRAQAGAEAAGGRAEEKLRDDYRAAVSREKSAGERVQAQLTGDDRMLASRLDGDMGNIANLRSQVQEVRSKLREKARARAETFRQKVLTEQIALKQFQEQVTSRENDTRKLVGQVALESFARVDRRFYDFVLSGDVGLIDVAWARKSERSERIKNLGMQKEGAVRQLKEDFKEVRMDIE